MAHGHSGSGGRRPESPTYRSWKAMRLRCTDKKHPYYNRYGGRGIAYDTRWDDFSAFLSDMGVRPEGMTLERIDNEQDYNKQNCTWISRKEQANNRCSSRRITWGEETLTIAQWAERTGICRNTIRDRIDKYGWSVQEALSVVPDLGNRWKRKQGEIV